MTMLTVSPSSIRRSFAGRGAAHAVRVILVAAAGSWHMVVAAHAQERLTTSPPANQAAAGVDGSIRPFRAHVPDETLVDLRRRIAATRWPDRETVADPSQGVQLGKLQELVRYWGTDYDWRRGEAKLNALPQFTTNIDGVDIQRRRCRPVSDQGRGAR
jgi:hypothetical protein